MNKLTHSQYASELLQEFYDAGYSMVGIDSGSVWGCYREDVEVGGSAEFFPISHPNTHNAILYCIANRSNRECDDDVRDDDMGEEYYGFDCDCAYDH